MRVLFHTQSGAIRSENMLLIFLTYPTFSMHSGTIEGPQNNCPCLIFLNSQIPMNVIVVRFFASRDAARLQHGDTAQLRRRLRRLPLRRHAPRAFLQA